MVQGEITEAKDILAWGSVAVAVACGRGLCLWLVSVACGRGLCPWPVSVALVSTSTSHVLLWAQEGLHRRASEAHVSLLCPFDLFGHCELRDYYLCADRETEAGEGSAVWP